jgi:hypothetical protein
MPKVTREVAAAVKNYSKPKYRFINYEPTIFDINGNISVLHVEGRYMDGSLSPAVITAHAALIYAIMIKAVELSKYGILRSGSSNYMLLQKEIWSKLCNGVESYNGPRVSDTRDLGPYIPDLKRQSKQLLNLVKSILLEQGPSYDILYRLAEEPQSFRRIKLKPFKNIDEWSNIEKTLMPKIKEEDDLVTKHIMKVIDLGSVSECSSINEWLCATAACISIEKGLKEDDEAISKLSKEIENKMSKFINDGTIFWSDSIGGYVVKS